MKKTFVFATSMMIGTSLFAAPIEQRNLSAASTTVSTDNSQQNMQIWELKQQVQQLQNQVRSLVGKLEEKEYQIDQLNKDLENRYTDLDQRLQIINEQLNPEDNPASTNNDADNSIQSKTDATNPSSAISSNNPVNIGPDQVAYNAAYEAYKAGGAAKAIKPMQNFINQYPNSPYISHAYYWLGEFNLSLTPPNIHEARDSFEVVAGNYPQSNKASAALYRLVEIALNIDKDINKARTHYQQLIQKYSNTQEAKTARNTFSL